MRKWPSRSWKPGQTVLAPEFAVYALFGLFWTGAASRFGLPVSTTHVSVGSLFGIGLVNGSARTATITAILAAWVTTLPAAALLAATAYAAIGP